MVFTNATLFPYQPTPLTNISPLTYRDGITFLEKLEIMRQWLNETLVPEFNAGIDHAISEMQDAMQVVNNKTGQAEIQRYTLADDFILEIDPVWPDNHMVNVVLTQNIVGGHAVTFGEDINNSVPVNQLPNEETDLWLVPEGNGTWTAFTLVKGQELIDAVTSINAAIALKADQADLDTTNTNVTDLTTEVSTKATTASVTALTGTVTTLTGTVDGHTTELGKKLSQVSTFAELVTAVAAGGTVRVSDTPITITAEIPVTTETRIVGGHFILPVDAAHAVFKVTASNVKFESCRFVGPGTSAEYSIDSRFIYAIGTSGSYLKNVDVIDCRMNGSQTENIRFHYVRDSVIERNNMDDFLYAGVMLLSCEDMTVSSNTITNALMKAPVVNVYGIAATDSSNVEATRSRNIKIIGNTIRNIAWEGIDTHGGEAIIITGNTVTSCGRGIALVSGNDTRLTVPEDCVVSGNFVDLGSATMTDREGISLFGLVGNLSSATITGNIVKGYQTGKHIYTTLYDPNKTLVEGNSHPHVDWTPITMSNTDQWVSHPDNPAEYKVDGRNVFFRGLINPVGAQSTANSLIGAVISVARPNNLSFPKTLKGAHSSSVTTGTLGVYSNGEIWFLYRAGATDMYSYAIDCTFQRKYTG